MTISSFKAQGERNCQYRGSWAPNQKSKDTLIFKIKVEEKKVSLVFLFKALDPRYDYFFF